MQQRLHLQNDLVTARHVLQAALLLALPVFGAINYTSRPLSFEPNRGQAPSAVRYVARGANYSVLMRDSGPVLKVGSETSDNTLAITFARKGSATHPVAERQLSATVNYFLGKDRSKWLAGVPTYGQVRYESVYPGIEVVYYGQQGELEYDFNISANADPSHIRVRFEGAGGPRLTEDGALTFGSRTNNRFRQHRPVAYQNISGKRTPVEVSYQVFSSNEVGFKLGEYDRSVPLVIDPTLSYSTYMGGSGTDGVTSVKVDATGALYMTGFTSSGSFRTTTGVLQTGYKGRVANGEFYGFGDAFVAKFSPTGTLAWSTYLGGGDDDVASGLAIDTSGNVFVTGATRSRDFPTSPGAYQTTFQGSTPDSFYSRGDAFVVKFSNDGSRILYGTYVGGKLNEAAWNIAVDGSGNAVIVGNTFSTDYPTTSNAISRAFLGAANAAVTAMGDAFVTRLNATGTGLLYSSYIGGSGHDMARSVAVDASGNMFLCGFTYSRDFPTTTGALQTTFKGVVSQSYDTAADDGWVMKIGNDGKLVYSTYLGGSFRDGCFGIAVDSVGAAYVTGHTQSTDFPVTAGAPYRTYAGSGANGNGGDAVKGDAFVAKLNPAGSGLVYSTYLGGSADDSGADIAVDSSGNAYVTGFSLSTNFPVSGDALQSTFKGFGGQGFNAGGPDNQNINFGDAFVAKLNAQGALSYSSYFGGSGDDGGASIAVDSGANVYVGGNTVSADLPMSNALQGTYGGTGALAPRGDGFVARFDFGGKVTAVPSKISFVSGNPTSGAAGAALSGPISVQVVDASGASLAGVTVTFTATNATVDPTTATTDNTGRASTNVSLGQTVGTARVTASVSGLTPVGLDLTVTGASSSPSIAAVVNGFSFEAPVAPGAWITIWGSAMAPAQADATTLPLPLQLGQVQVLVNEKPVPLLFVSPTQINVQLPYETPLGDASVVVRSGTVSSPPFRFTVLNTAPGIVPWGDRAVAQNVADDGSVTLNAADNPAKPNKPVVIYFTGQGPLDNPVPTGNVAPASPLSRALASYSVTVGGKAATVDFIGLTPTFVALAQANIRIPADLTTPGDYPVVITIDGRSSPSRVITVRP